MENSENKEKIDKKNLAYKAYRFLTTVPKNCILIKENVFTKEAKVVAGGMVFSWPFEKTVGLSLDAKTYDFPPQVFQAGVSQSGEDFDIEVDAAITYRIKGGDMPVEIITAADGTTEIIKSKNKELRRKWQKEHGALKVYFDLHNDRERIKKQLQTVVYDALRRYVSSNTYETILTNHIDENSELFIEVNEQLSAFGIEILNFNIQNVNQVKEINEAESKAKALELESVAQADALKREAVAKADAYKLQGMAEAEIIREKGIAEAEAASALAKAKVEAFDGKSYSEIAAMNEKEFKNINLNLTTSNSQPSVNNNNNNTNNSIMNEIQSLKQMLDELQAATTQQQEELKEQKNDEETASWDFDDAVEETVVETPNVIYLPDNQMTVSPVEETVAEEDNTPEIDLPEESALYNALQTYSTDVTEEIINQINEDNENVIEQAGNVKSLGSIDIIPGGVNRR